MVAMLASRTSQEEARLAALRRYDIIGSLPEHAFDRLAHLAARILDTPIALVSLVVEDRQWFKACVGLDIRETERVLSFCAHAISQDDVFVVNDASLDPRFEHNALVTDEPNIRFYAGAPLVTPEGFKLGTLCVIDVSPRATFGEKERETLRDLAAIVVDEMELRAVKLQIQEEAREKTRLLEELQESAGVQAALLGVSNLMQSDLPPTDVVMRALELVSRAADVDWCSLVAIRDEEAWMEAVWTRDPSGNDVTRSLPSKLRRGRGVMWDVVANGQARYASSYEQEAHASSAMSAAGMKSAAWLPLGQYDGTSYIVMYGRLHRERPWTERDRQLLEAAAGSVRRAMEFRERTRRMQDAALTDALTRLGNRRAFNEAMSARGSGSAVRVLAIDLDGVKEVNETLGPAAGDALLRVFAVALAEHLPANTTAYRLDSARFMVLFEGGASVATLKLARSVAAEHVEQALGIARSVGFERITAWCGVGSWPEEAPTLHDAVRLAEIRLYEDKRSKARGASPSAPSLGASPKAGTSNGSVSVNGVTVNVLTRTVQFGTKSVALRPKEVVLLATLASAPDQVVSHEELQEALGGPSVDVSNALTMHVMNVRRKLSQLAAPVKIRAVRGSGYSLQTEVDEAP
ncbi:GAF domain-containing protein [Deinococcus yavapaiensis]|uniref:Diguanylate cyclase (GGDEF)-like protein n=1 Tax=Deinococcus yavapaiensis KR-236 TaxID=694435 RepID=A0A318SI73_9DEIO|nr:GAF domain-containing protein [Deinococcus yavapaiensis]PYE53757.1 diguanylate cyclase (GGDEF)-like protein [Deinococcus yavapaiensis KR-236]